MIIPEIKKILYATDLSDNARYAFSYSASLGNLYGAAITILHVLGPAPPDDYVSDLSAYLGSEKWEEIRSKLEKETINDIKARLDKFCQDVTGEKASCAFTVDEILVKRGNPVEEILREAQEGDYDMVVMGTHGHGTLADAMMGSTARRVLRRSKKPVLVVPLPEGEDD
jgi:nucleotide-binding universal stress UspA family protein